MPVATHVPLPPSRYPLEHEPIATQVPSPPSWLGLTQAPVVVVPLPVVPPCAAPAAAPAALGSLLALPETPILVPALLELVTAPPLAPGSAEPVPVRLPERPPLPAVLERSPTL